MHDDMIKMGGILRAARKAKGLSQVALSGKIGTAARTIMDIENDKRHPTYEVLSKIIRALDFSADQIFWPEKVPYTPEQEQLIRAVAACNEHDKAIFMKIAWEFVRASSEGDNLK
jgi:putative transcriptional regulator